MTQPRLESQSEIRITTPETKRQREQRLVERTAVIWLCVTSLIAAFLTGGAPPGATFRSFMEEFGAWLTPTLFAGLFLVGALLSLALPSHWMQRRDVISRRALYYLCATPFILYTAPIGWYAIRIGGGGLSGVVYLFFFGHFIVIARATYRE